MAAAVAVCLVALLVSPAVSSPSMNLYQCFGPSRVHVKTIPSGPCKLFCCGNNSKVDNSIRASFHSPLGPVMATEPGFSPPTCDYNSGNGDFLCSIEKFQADCMFGNYTCTVIVRGSHESVEIVTGRHRLPEAPECLPPHIFNVSVTLEPSGIMLLRWNYTQTEGKPYCKGTRQFQVAYRNYASYDVARHDTNYENEVESYKNVSRRVTEFGYRGLSRDHFYRFSVRAKRGVSYDFFTPPVITPIQYFARYVPVQWAKGIKYFYHVREGDEINIQCAAIGTPTPTVEYRHYGSSHNLERLWFARVHPDDAGQYVCRACHEKFNNADGSFKSVCISQVIELSVTEKDKNRDCLEYTGTHCSEYIHHDWHVLVTNSTHGLELEQHLTNIVQLSDGFSEKCRVLVKSALCHALLPYCSPFTLTDEPYSAIPTCPLSCRQLEERCGEEIREHGGSFAELLAGSCDSQAETRGPGEKPGCTFIDPDYPLKEGPRPDELPVDHVECIMGNGRSYRGVTQRAESGQGCQRWDVQFPNKHQMLQMMGGELEGAWKYCRNPGGLGERPWCFVRDATTRWGYCSIPKCEQCVSYSGEFCKQAGYTTNTSVLFRQQLKSSMAALELEMGGLLHLTQESLSPGCELAAHQLLCFGALPICQDDTELQVCDSHCRLLDLLQLCPTDLQEAVLSLPYIDFSMCENGIAVAVTEGSNSSCLPDPLPALRRESEDCRNRSSEEPNTTLSGAQCVPWTQPPAGRRLTETFPELLSGSSLCHNPGRLRMQPWCFVSSDGTWEYCNMTSCSASRRSLDLHPTTTSQPSHHTTITAFATVGTVLVVAVLVVGSVVALYQVKKNKKTHSVRFADIQNENYPTNPARPSLPPALQEMTQTFRRIEKTKIRYVKEIGQGNFGIVFQGECAWLRMNNATSRSWEDGEKVNVAVKTHKPESSQQTIEDFVCEAKVLHQLSHPNIVEFYGVCMDELPYYMVFEYMDQGDLCQFLRSHGNQKDSHGNPIIGRRRTSSSSSNESVTLSTMDLLDICRQIAGGMAYLESEKYVHRDLAARNCLVSSGLIVKVADFGMSKNLYSKDYYRIAGEASLPIRWMAPESIVYGTFSTKGDVWAFGVVVWEVFSFGCQPYWGLVNETVVEMVRKGKLLDKPDGCPDKLFSLIKRGCWSLYENERMSFKALKQVLETFRLSDSNSSYASSVEAQLDDVFEDVVAPNDDDRDY